MTSSPSDIKSPWALSPKSLSFSTIEFHIWKISLDHPLETISHYYSLLSDDERQRAQSYRTESLRSRYIVGRGALRTILASYLQVDPAQLKFRYGSQGKPALEPGGSLEFNLAHSHGLALCAVTSSSAVGIDLEAIRPMDDAERIIKRFFSPYEQAAFLTLDENLRLPAFFRAWTRKEAFLKATGTGLATELDAFDVTLGPEDPVAILRIGSDPIEATRWSLLDIDVEPGFVGAFATRHRVDQNMMRYWEWNFP